MLYRLLVAIALLVPAGHFARAADIAQHNVLAHGDNERFWVGHVEQTPGVVGSTRTTVYYRPIGQDNRWQVLAVIPARIVSLASRADVPAAMLDDGAWMALYAEGGPVTMGPLPAPARMVALAGGHDTWWAVGVAPGGMSAVKSAAATRPATQAAQAAPSTQPRTQPSAARLVLFSLQGNDWKPLAELPDLVSNAPSVSLAVPDGTPWVADMDSVGALHVRRLAGQKWVAVEKLGDFPNLTGFGLLDDNSVPRLWVQQRSGPDRLYALAHPTTSAAELPPIPGGSPVDRAVAIATGKIRMVAVVSGRLLELDFRAADAVADGSPFPLPIPKVTVTEEFQFFRWLVVLAALTAAVLTSFRQRALLRGTTIDLDKLNIAPLGRRLAAGLIDLAPVLLALTGGLFRFVTGHPVSDQNRQLLITLLCWSAGVFYILYTTIVEVLAGRSLGKLLLGLRVVDFKGDPAKPAALVIRNLLRIIDVGLFFVPTLMIILLPLRQRAGDVAAGTLVVSDKVIPDPLTTEPVTTVSTTEEKV